MSIITAQWSEDAGAREAEFNMECRPGTLEVSIGAVGRASLRVDGPSGCLLDVGDARVIPSFRVNDAEGELRFRSEGRHLIVIRAELTPDAPDVPDFSDTDEYPNMGTLRDFAEEHGIDLPSGASRSEMEEILTEAMLAGGEA